ncbi:hypothetical protein VPHK71_0014 [Vibrio phage K71]
MKNVQMRINPELYAKFKLVDGESNNERMAKLLDDSREKYELVELNNHKYFTIRDLNSKLSTEVNQKKNLASALVVSIAVSVACVGYVCMINGWLS